MGGKLGFYHLRSLQLDWLGQVVEQPGASTENDWRHVQMQALDQAGLQGLRDHAGTAHDMHLLIASGGARLCDCGLDAVGDESEGCLALHNHVVRAVRKHEDRPAIQATVAPSSRAIVDLSTRDDSSRGREQRASAETGSAISAAAVSPGVRLTRVNPTSLRVGPAYSWTTSVPSLSPVFVTRSRAVTVSYWLASRLLSRSPE